MDFSKHLQEIAADIFHSWDDIEPSPLVVIEADSHVQELLPRKQGLIHEFSMAFVFAAETLGSKISIVIEHM